MTTPTAASAPTAAHAPMRVLRLKLRFLTPAFLGDAEKNGRWRTPPFKHLVREWWRVAYAAETNFHVDVKQMRREEALLFGHAWLEDDYFVKEGRRQRTTGRKGRLRLLLRSATLKSDAIWGVGTQRGVQPLSTGIETSYAWFGLIKRGGGLPDRTALKPGGEEGCRELYLVYPDEPAINARIREVVRLITTFGLVGSRSRGGWGALHIEGSEPLNGPEVAKYTRPFDKCLKDDWAMSLARDTKGPVVWSSKKTAFSSWHEVMGEISKLRRDVRHALKNTQGKDFRPALGFAGAGRMPSPLRWKVFLAGTDQLGFRVFALPHRLPDESGKRMELDDLAKAWEQICRALDSSNALKRVS
jgi:CRISPR-associated protein Cmr1